MDKYDKWLGWANELQSMAKAGLYYGVNIYDRERYERIIEISEEIIAHKTELPAETVHDLFGSDDGYLTPKLDTRAVIFRDGKILLVREGTGKWALPGGWVDVDQSLRENVVKEVREETGLDATAGRMIAALDRDKHNYPLHARKIIICFIECTVHGGKFRENSETVEARYFARGEYPSPLAVEKTTEAELDLCFRAKDDPNWQTIFD